MAEGGRLLTCYTGLNPYREFESRSLRHAPYGAWLRRLINGYDSMNYFYIYILQSKNDKQLYIGFTNNLQNRLKQHNAGEVKSTRPRKPLDLIFFEAYTNKYDALRREKYFKTTKGKTTVKTMLKEYFSN